MPPTSTIFEQLGISVLLGLLVGLQREHAATGMPGMRTFPLITLLGTISALLAVEFGGWIVAASLLGLVAMLAFPNVIRMRQKEPDPGMTTNVAVLVMYGVGALLVAAPMAVAIVVGGAVAVLLQFKPELHRFSEKLGDADLRAIMQFVLITCIILPVLPHRTFDQFHVLDPFEIWLVVVLIVGISLGGYIVYKFLGREAGILLGGILGGSISSTATTVSYARQARDEPASTRVAAIVITIASTVLFVRLLVEIAVVSPSFLAHAAAPLVAMMLLTLLPALVLWCRVRGQHSPMPEQKNPTHLKSAIVFAIMYAVVLFALAAAKQFAHGQAMYPLAVLSGIADVDAINLSTARLAETDPEIMARGWRLIVVAVLSSMFFKAALAGLLGNRQLLTQVALLYCIPLVGGIALLLFWPDIPQLHNPAA